MRQWHDIFDYKPLLVGTLGAAVGGTAISAPVDVSAFADVLGIVTYGACGGTATDVGYLEIRFQESATVGTGSSFADITDGAVMGSMKILTAALTAPTNPYLACTSFYERMHNNDRKKYIRPIATMTGTAGCRIMYTVGVLLGRPIDTLYISKATTSATMCDEFTKPMT